MYAILEHGGHQYRVASGDRLLIDRLPAEVGSTVTLEPVLFIGDGERTTADPESLKGAHVTAVVVAHRLGHKIRVFSYKPKKRHRRTLGYRSKLTELRVDAVVTATAEPAPKRRPAKSSAGGGRGTGTTRRKAGDGA